MRLHPFTGGCFRSFTISTGCVAPFTYRRAFVPDTCILTFVHYPATRSTYDSSFPGLSARNLFHGNPGTEMYCVAGNAISRSD
jgi:hypothetical protein